MFHDAFGLSSRQRKDVKRMILDKSKTIKEIYAEFEGGNVAQPQVSLTAGLADDAPLWKPEGTAASTEPQASAEGKPFGGATAPPTRLPHDLRR